MKFLKQIIRSWLGVKDERPEYELRVFVRTEIRNYLHKGFCEGDEYYSNELLQGLLVTVVQNALKNQDLKVVKNYVHGEEFIDDLVQRIKNKQL